MQSVVGPLSREASQPYLLMEERKNYPRLRNISSNTVLFIVAIVEKEDKIAKENRKIILSLKNIIN